MRGVQIEHGSPEVEALWATPTSGYGHVSDEQALPRILERGLDLTPGMSGEPVHCPPEIIGLPQGRLNQPWPWRQRLFNVPRRSVNRYWRELFESRCRPDGTFRFWEQLDFVQVPGGFVGQSPAAVFRRQFRLSGRTLTVEDVVEFRIALRFSEFSMLNMPLFEDWTIQTPSARWLEVETDQPGEWLSNRFSSSTGHAVLWRHQTFSVEYDRGQVIRSRCTYHF